MSHPFTLSQQLKPIAALVPATDAAGRTGRYISLKGIHKVFAVFNITQGNAATVLLSIYQATTVAAAGEKVIVPTVPIFVNLDVAASDTMVRAADGVNYTTDAGVKNKIVVFEIEASVLDTNNGFDCLTVKTGASNAANLTSCVYHVIARNQALAQSHITD